MSRRLLVFLRMQKISFTSYNSESQLADYLDDRFSRIVKRRWWTRLVSVRTLPNDDGFLVSICGLRTERMQITLSGMLRLVVNAQQSPLHLLRLWSAMDFQRELTEEQSVP